MNAYLIWMLWPNNLFFYKDSANISLFKKADLIGDSFKMAHLVEDLLNDVYKQVDEDLKNYTQIWTECEQWLDDVVKEAEKIFR